MKNVFIIGIRHCELSGFEKASLYGGLFSTGHETAADAKDYLQDLQHRLQKVPLS